MVLLIFDFAEVKIGKVNVLGTDLIVGNAKVLMTCAWILWGYFLLRYYQYWRAEEKHPLRYSFATAIVKCSKDFRNSPKFQKLYPDTAYAFEMRSKSYLNYELFRTAYEPGPGANVDVDVYPVNAVRAAIWKTRAAWHVLAHTPHATDHILPFTLAAAALVLNLTTLAKTHGLFPRLEECIRMLRDCSGLYL